MSRKLSDLFKYGLSYHRFIGVLLIAGGIGYMMLLSNPNFNNRCYFSEKALSPGVIEEQFSQTVLIGQYYEQVKEMYTADSLDSGKFQQWLENELLKVGLDTYTQNFSFNYPLILGDKKLYGTNVVGTSRAYRAARTEALVLMTPLRVTERHTAGSVALMLALAKFFRQQTYWAKDIVFLFTEMEIVGLQAWLHAYHGVSHLLKPTVTVAEPLHRSGSIQAALSLELEHPTVWAKPTIHVEGVNGVLPNLDLFNTAVRIGLKHGVRLTLHGSDRQPALLLRSLLYQASGSPSSLHGLFLPFDIPAIGLSGSASGGGSTGNPRAAAVVVEGIWRSLNNLQERLHQSFFFYALPDITRYVSIGDYTPPLGAIILALALAAISAMVDGFGEPAAGGVGGQLGTKSVAGPVIRLAIMAFCFGLFACIAPYYLIRAAASFRIEAGSGTIIGLAAVQGMAAAFPKLFPSMIATCHPGALRLCASLALGVSLGALSMVNFGLAFLAACPMGLACVLAAGPSRLSGWLRAPLGLFVFVAASPVGLLLGGCWAGVNFNPSGLLGAWNCAEYAALQGFIEGHLLNGLTYRLFCLMLLPCWLLLWSQLFAVDQQQPVVGGGGIPAAGAETVAEKGEEKKTR